MLKVINVVGARSNFMKVAPIVAAMKRREREFAPLLVHTGQHFDADMSDAFFRDLDLPAFGKILAALEDITEKLPVVFPAHPRTRKTIASLG